MTPGGGLGVSRFIMRQRVAAVGLLSARRLFSTALRRRLDDEGDWFYAREFWGSESSGHIVFDSKSDKGNGVVSVVAHPSSRPEPFEWPGTERWLKRRYDEVVDPCGNSNERFRIMGYQWRSLRFNDVTRQSTVKVMAAEMESDPASVIIMQQPHCLATPYLKSMIATGLASLLSSKYDLASAALGKMSMNILCIGHGGGSLPLFLASKIQGAAVDIVEIDPLVVKASTQAMGFPSFSVPSCQRAFSTPSLVEDVLWRGVHERLFLHTADAEDFIQNTNDLYDLVFIDAYDGEDIFPRKLWNPDAPFLKSLSSQLHPTHGTVVVNLHSDADILNPDGSLPSVFEQILPMGKYVSGVCQAYKDTLLKHNSAEAELPSYGYTVSVPQLCNTSLVVSRGFRISTNFKLTRDLVLNTLSSKSYELENVLNLPFSCLQYLRTGFVLLD